MHIVTLFKHGKFWGTVAGSRDNVIVPTLSSWLDEHVEGEYDDTWWLRAGLPVKRQQCPAIADGLWLRGVRPNSTIYIDGQAYDCEEGGDVELSFQYPGTYEVRVECWPYLDGSYAIENTSQAE